MLQVYLTKVWGRRGVFFCFWRGAISPKFQSHLSVYAKSDRPAGRMLTAWSTINVGGRSRGQLMYPFCYGRGQGGVRRNLSGQEKVAL